MDTEISLFVLLALGLLIGAVLGWISFFRLGELRNELNALRDEFARLRRQFEQEPPPASALAPTPAAATTNVTELHSPPPRPRAIPPAAQPAAPAPAPRARWLESLKENWMIWLGGISVALAGIFMVKYSIDIGLLGPTARVALGILTGLALHAAAEWLRRRTGGSHPVFAALAGGASITLYAALLAALHLYHLLDPRLVFVLLALVSLLTMALALLHGPELAMIGLVGAYVVPVLVETGSHTMVGVMIYSLIISAAALLLLRYVFRYWLWGGVLAGALGWWLVSLTAIQAEAFRGLYLALLAWGMLAIPALDWRLRNSDTDSAAGTQPVSVFRQPLQLNQLGLLLVTLAWSFSIYRQGFTPAALWLWSPLVVVLFLAARRRDSLAVLPWLTLVLQWLAWLGSAIHPVGDRLVLAGLPAEQQTAFLTFAGLTSLLYVALALWHTRERGLSHGWLSLALLAPLAWLALAYLLVNGLSQSLLWSMPTLLAGVAYATLASVLVQRRMSELAALWLSLGANVAYAMAVTMYFREATLTLALAAQLLSLSWLMKRYRQPWLGWPLKALLAVVVIRLTFNPWLLSYPAHVHWSLWTYGGATLFCALSSLQTRSLPALQRWLEAATLQLLVLTLGAEVRYQLYDGAIFVHRYGLTEAAINTSLWAGLALAYYRRGLASAHLAALYRAASRILLALSLASYAVAALIHNPWWSAEPIGRTPVFNLLLLAYGLPVIMALLVARYHEPGLRRPALRLAGLALLLFAALEIRHLWQGGTLSLSAPTGDGELYTYSVAGLLMAVAAMLTATHWRLPALYRAGLGLLAGVIAKIFLIDMSGLQGLWRVASFMGLGLSLLGLAWLHQRMQAGDRNAAQS